MAERLEIAEVERRRATGVALPPRSRLFAANDNVPPVRHLVGKLALAASLFAGTFVFAIWWLG